MDRKAELLIGSPQSEHLRVVPLSRPNGDSTDYWDSNWLEAQVELSAGAFTGAFRATLRTDEFARFREQLAALYEDLEGKAEFQSLERWLSIRVSGDGRGHFEARCEARDDPAFGNTLRFSLKFDQTELPGILRGLAALEQAFPVEHAAGRGGTP